MKFILKVLIIVYQRIVSPLTTPSCRFTPTCSNYALEAIKKKNLITAIKLIIKRISKCHPWGGSGYDPIN
jgi:putative membrane protein insertion efficiency factor|tara:strand:- start:28740 stop:28949 length:210 start_codon:yes stop_codon:yes gene_type:complete